jgi:crotonobetaine/carnitine-CoA ligase
MSMISTHQDATIGEVFFSVANTYPTRPFLIAPANAEREYNPQGRLLTYDHASKEVRTLIVHYKKAGYGVGHRVALLLDNRIEHFLHKIALNALGICCVPVNPDYKARELAYLIEHSQVDLVLLLSKRLG